MIAQLPSPTFSVQQMLRKNIACDANYQVFFECEFRWAIFLPNALAVWSPNFCPKQQLRLRLDDIILDRKQLVTPRFVLDRRLIVRMAGKCYRT